MKIFLSWHGAPSHEAAKALKIWLPRVIQSIDPFLSSGDIDAGTRWDEEIRQQLLVGRAGILCLGPDNLDSTWIHYEAGALSKTVEKTMVIPYLSGVKPGDLNKPLSAFNACIDDEHGTRHMLQTINKGCAQPLSETVLADAFAKQWGDLRKMLDAIPASTKQVPEKTDRELMERLISLASGSQDAIEEIRYQLAIGDSRKPGALSFSMPPLPVSGTAGANTNVQTGYTLRDLAEGRIPPRSNTANSTE